jgi:hypothetical protein
MMIIQTITDPMTLHVAAEDRITIVTQVSGDTVNQPTFSYDGNLLDVQQFLGLPGVQFTVRAGAKELALTFTFSSAGGSTYQLSEVLGGPPARLSPLEPVFSQTLPSGAAAGEVAIFTVVAP